MWLANAPVVVIDFLTLSVVCLIVTGRVARRAQVIWVVKSATAIVSIALDGPAVAIKLTPLIFVLCSPRREGPSPR